MHLVITLYLLLTMQPPSKTLLPLQAGLTGRAAARVAFCEAVCKEASIPGPVQGAPASGSAMCTTDTCE
jgi:hypothetical protein